MRHQIILPIASETGSSSTAVVPHTAVGQVCFLAKTGLNLLSHQITTVHRLAEAGKAFLLEQATAFLNRLHGIPVLISRSGDGTPIVTKEHFISGSGDLAVHRIGRKSHELLLQRVFLMDVSGEQHIIIDEPTDLSSGKDCWTLFAAERKFWTTGREHGYEGLIVSHYAYDRAIFANMLSKARMQHRKASHEVALQKPELNFAELDLKDWVVGTACGDHDAQNSLKWALAPVLPDGSSSYDDLYIVVESVRNGFSILMTDLPSWLIGAVLFVHDAFPDCYQLWVALGVEPKWADELGDMRLRFEGGFLKLRHTLQAESGWMDRVSTCLLYLWRFKQFTASRWLTIGSVCRALLRSFMSGFHDLVAHARANPKHSDYHLHGWARLTPRLRHLVAVAAISSYVPDAFIVEALTDDRVAFRLEDFLEAIHSELEFVSNIPDQI